MDIGWCMFCDKQTPNPEDVYCSAQCRNSSVSSPDRLIPSDTSSPMGAITPSDSYFAPFLLSTSPGSRRSSSTDTLGQDGDDIMLADIRWDNNQHSTMAPFDGCGGRRGSYFSSRSPTASLSLKGFNTNSNNVSNSNLFVQKARAFALPPCSVKIVRPAPQPQLETATIDKARQQQKPARKPISLSRGHGYQDLTQLVSKVETTTSSTSSTNLANSKKPKNDLQQQSLETRASTTLTDDAKSAKVFDLSALSTSLEDDEAGQKLVPQQHSLDTKSKTTRTRLFLGNDNDKHFSFDSDQDDFSDYASSYSDDSIYDDDDDDDDEVLGNFVSCQKSNTDSKPSFYQGQNKNNTPALVATTATIRAMH